MRDCLRGLLVVGVVLATLVTAYGTNTVIEFWTTDNEPDRVDVYEAVATRFTAANPGIEVRIIPVGENDISQRIATAVAADQLPDIVRMGIERVAVFATEGILDQDAAEAVIASVGKSDFRAGPLAMVIDPATGKYAAVPYDGWIQAIWYRIDMFKEAGLTPPISWVDINAAADALPGTGNLLYALTLATDPGQNYAHQFFEQVAMSNNAWPFDAEGNVTMNTPEMIVALQFYTNLQRAAVPGPQYWRGAREAYELDQAGMLFYSSYIMDDLVNGSFLPGGSKVDILVEDLAFKTGFAAQMVGPNGSASYGQLVTLGIMDGADPAAQKVVEYFLTEGYIDILSVSPFGKVPVLKSAVDGWKELSPFFAYYSSETLDQIANGFESMQRWLFRPDYGPVERAVVSDIEGRLLIPQVISNIALEGIMTPETGAIWLQDQVEIILQYWKNKVRTNEPPVANFTWQALAASGTRLVVEPRTGDRIQFDASSSSAPEGRIVKYEWDWDSDGVWDKDSTDPVAENSFMEVGVHRVTLRVANNDNLTDEITKTIVIAHRDLIQAEFTFHVVDEILHQIYLDASASIDTMGTIVRYEWDWDGDGIYDTAVQVAEMMHRFEGEGPYQVILTIVDDQGNRASCTKEVRP